MKILECNNCHGLTKIPMIHGLEKLDCSDCNSLTQISMIQGLQTMECRGCFNLISIPLIDGLQELNCSGCTGLTEIPLINSLQALDCSGCSGLVEIPLIHGLQWLKCRNNRKLTSLPYDEKSDIIIDIFGCIWLNHILNQRYDENIKNLKIIQRWAKRMVLRKRLIALIPCLMPLYYDPGSKGGYFHKKNMFEFIDSII